MRIITAITASLVILGCASQEQDSNVTIRCVPAVRATFTPGDTLVDSEGNTSSDDTLESELIISDGQRIYVFNWLPAVCEFLPEQKYTFVLESGGHSVQSIQDSDGKTIWKVSPDISRARVPLIRIEELDNVEQRN